MTAPAAAIGVVGAGQMGAGIAQLAALAGSETFLFDAFPAALDRGHAQIEEGFERLLRKGRLDESGCAAARGRLRLVSDLTDLRGCDLVAEAVPERLDLKQTVLSDAAAVVGADCVLATNTSSLSITEIASAIDNPSRVVGLHFFNPVPVMKLAEVIAGAQSSPAALGVARATAEAMGKTVVAAADVPGFLVNRVNRPFFLESLRIVEEGIASVEQVDRIVRMGGGFRMGPFELMDLIGIDTNHAIAESFHARSFGEPRFRPSPLAAGKIAAGQLGRKSGSGWFDYGDGAPRAHDPVPQVIGDGDGRVVVIDPADDSLTDLAASAEAAGWRVASPDDGDRDAWLSFAGRDDGRECPRVVLCRDGSLHAQDPRAIGLSFVGPLAPGMLVEITMTAATDPLAVDRLTDLLQTIGLHVERVGDGPGLVLHRVIATLVNEAAFLVGEGHATQDDVDVGMTLGVNHPRGPFAWLRDLGPAEVLATLRGLADETADPRYRIAPLLRRSAAIERSDSDPRTAGGPILLAFDIADAAPAP